MSQNGGIFALFAYFQPNCCAAKITDLLFSVRRLVGKKEPVFQAIWADNTNFNQIIISPVMIQDHMPDKMLEALQNLLVHTGPAKPQRKVQIIKQPVSPPKKPLLADSPKTRNSLDVIESPKKVIIETSFTASPLIAQNAQNHKRLNSRSVRPNQLPTDQTKVDLIRDDWMGAAPLASPETMSDISSISSRSNGVRASWAALPVFTINERQYADQRVVSDQPLPDPESNDSESSQEVITQTNDVLNIPLVENEHIQNNDNHYSNIYTIEVVNKNLVDDGKALNLDISSLNNNRAQDQSHDLFGYLEVKDENFNNTSSHSSDNNVQEFNSTEVIDSRCESSNENESLPTLHRFSSDTDLSNTLDPKPQPLRRSHEEIHLNNLDDSTDVFEVGAIANGESLGDASGQISPTLKMLFHKLLTIESPTAESAVNQVNDDSDVNANQITSHFSGNQF